MSDKKTDREIRTEPCRKTDRETERNRVMNEKTHR